MDANREIEAYKTFREVYEIQHPPPKERAVLETGWKFWITALTAFMAVILASMRTMFIIYDAAKLSGVPDAYAYIEAGSALFAIEGGLVVFAALRAEKNGGRETRGITEIGISLMVLISLAAGLGQSSKLIPDLPSNVYFVFSVFLAIVIGIGATIIAWVAAENLGSQWVLISNDAEKAQIEHEAKMVVYLETMNTEWEHSPERSVAREDIRIQKRLADQSVRSVAVPEVYRGTDAVQDGTYRGTNGTNGVEHKTDKVFEYLDELYGHQRWLNPGEVPGPRQITRALPDMPVSSAARGRNRWIKEHFLDG